VDPRLDAEVLHFARVPGMVFVNHGDRAARARCLNALEA
jgi:hypothetical protein